MATKNGNKLILNIVITTIGIYFIFFILPFYDLVKSIMGNYAMFLVIFLHGLIFSFHIYY